MTDQPRPMRAWVRALSDRLGVSLEDTLRYLRPEEFHALAVEALTAQEARRRRRFADFDALLVGVVARFERQAAHAQLAADFYAELAAA